MKKILLIIDPQNDFIKGSLPVEGAREAIYKLTLFLTLDRGYDQVIITADMHPDNHCSFIDNGGQWPVHCVRHTSGCKIDSQLLSVVDVQYPNNRLILDKGLNADHEEYSILENKDSRERLFPILKEADEIHVCGIAGDFCVLNTVIDLVVSGFKDKVIILKDFIASTDQGAVLDKYITKNGLKCY